MPDTLYIDSLATDTVPVCALSPAAGCAPDSAVCFGCWENAGAPSAAGKDAPALTFFRLADLHTAGTPGVAGDLRPYDIGAEDGFAAILLLTAFFAVSVTVRSWRSLCEMFSALFRAPVADYERSERAASETRGFLFFVFLAAFVQGILFFVYAQACLPDAFADVPPPVLPVVAVASCFFFHLGKFALYRMVNSVLFDRSRTVQWADAYLLSLFASGFLLLPVVLSAVYFGLSLHHCAIALVSVSALVGLVLFFRCFRIFFRHGLGYVHIILYFCALEILPAFVLWRFLHWISLNLTIIV